MKCKLKFLLRNNTRIRFDYEGDVDLHKITSDKGHLIFDTLWINLSDVMLIEKEVINDTQEDRDTESE